MRLFKPTLSVATLLYTVLILFFAFCAVFGPAATAFADGNSSQPPPAQSPDTSATGQSYLSTSGDADYLISYVLLTGLMYTY